MVCVPMLTSHTKTINCISTGLIFSMVCALVGSSDCMFVDTGVAI